MSYREANNITRGDRCRKYIGIYVGNTWYCSTPSSIPFQPKTNYMSSIILEEEDEEETALGTSLNCSNGEVTQLE